MGRGNRGRGRGDHPEEEEEMYDEEMEVSAEPLTCSRATTEAREYPFSRLGRLCLRGNGLPFIPARSRHRSFSFAVLR